MMFSFAKPARAGVLAAAAMLAVIAAVGVSPAVAVPLPAVSPSPSGSTVTFESGVFCPPKTCIGGNGFLCIGGSDCGLWFLRHGCTDCPRLALDYELRVYTLDREPELRTGRIFFSAGQTGTTLVFRTAVPVTSMDIQLSLDGVVVHRQTVG